MTSIIDEQRKPFSPNFFPLFPSYYFLHRAFFVYVCVCEKEREREREREREKERERENSDDALMETAERCYYGPVTNLSG